MIPIMMIPIVVVAVIFMVPVTLMEGPALLVVIIVRVVPICSRVRRSPPNSRDPHIPSPYGVPISIDPSVARTW